VKRFMKLKAAQTSQQRRYPARYERVLPLVFASILLVIIVLVVVAVLVLAGVFPAAR